MISKRWAGKSSREPDDVSFDMFKYYKNEVFILFEELLRIDDDLLWYGLMIRQIINNRWHMRGQFWYFVTLVHQNDRYLMKTALSLIVQLLLSGK